MPLLKASIKDLRKSQKRRIANRDQKQRMKEHFKAMLKLAREKNWEEFRKKLPEVTSLIDKAAKRYLLHANNAARKKSRLAHLLATAK